MHLVSSERDPLKIVYFRYKWQLNGTDIDNSNPEVLAFDSATGDITLGEFFGPLNSGDYQCIVSNDYGTAMTPYLTLLATSKYVQSLELGLSVRLFFNVS